MTTTVGSLDELITVTIEEGVGIELTVENLDISVSGAVISVNGEDGDVVLTQDDIGDGTTYKQFSGAEKTKLSGIETGAEVNNISDVNATDLTDGGATTLHKHSYNDLDNKPTIPDELADLTGDSTHRTVTDTEKNTWNGKSDLALGDLSTNAFPGDKGKTAYDHSQVAHAPSDAEKNVQTDWSQADTGADDFLKNKPTTMPPSSHNHDATDVNSGTIDGDRLPAISTTKAGAVPATGTPSGKYLKDDGTWATVSGSGTPAGSTTEIQYNASGSFGASSNFKYDSDGSGNYLYLDGAKIYGDYATTNYLYSSRNVWLPQLHLGSSAAVAYLSTIVTGSSKTNVKIFSEENTVFSTAIKLPNSTPGTLAEGQLYFDGTHLYFRIGSTSYQIDQQSAGSMVYPGSGIALSTGSAWGTSIADNSANWNAAYGWGNHASAGYLASNFLSLGSLTDPNDDKIMGWDDTDGALKMITLGANLSYDHASHTISATAGATAGIWSALTGTYASASTFTFAGDAEDAKMVQFSLFTCLDSGTYRKVGYIKSATESGGTVTCTVVSSIPLATGDQTFYVAYNRKVHDYLHMISIPGELIADTEYSQGTWYLDLMADMYLLPVDFSVRTAAAGAGAALTLNIYEDAVAQYAAAPDMTTNTELREQPPRVTLGCSTDTQFDITNPAGTTFRYTFDGTGTDPSISATNPYVGELVIISGQNFNAGNNGSFVVTASAANYFEVTNAAGVAENNKTIGTGYIRRQGLVPCTLASGANVSLRIMSSAGTTNKAADFQAKLFIVPANLFTAI